MLKEKIKKNLEDRRNENYERELAERRSTYVNWYRSHKYELETELARLREEKPLTPQTVEVVRYSKLRRYILSGREMPEIIIACDDDGELTDYAQELILRFFADNPWINLVYGDEDRIGDSGEYCDPWMKSDWSPDTFLSTFYFGNVFAMRSQVLSLINPGRKRAEDIESRSRLEEDSMREARNAKSDLSDALRAWIYGKLCLKIAQAEGGFTKRYSQEFPVGHIPEILFHASRKSTPWDSNLIKGSLTGRYSDVSAASRLVSIIIPSKDNPKILAQCIHSIEQFSEGTPYEIIVVDNGSNDENRRKVERLISLHNQVGEARYLYEPMEFNFSRMCNLGAGAAAGELLLFLNDDVEISRPKWLSYLSEKAKLPYVGCVGMKLLYPNSDIIQHAGIVNVHAGPIHKLQFCNNTEEHYFGFNKGVRNCIGVTGACLMLRKDLFFEVGGFDEENFSVAFNDVDLCLKVFERGYYNVVRNNMYLYHHESLSRGDDRKDKVKSQRLNREQRALLSMHPDLFIRDPFYHQYLTQDPAVTEFTIDVDEVELRNPRYVEPKRRRLPIPGHWYDPVEKLGVEFANALDRWLTGPLTDKAGEAYLDKGYYIKGYSFVINANQAVYDRVMILKNEENGALWEVPVENAYRPDIAEKLTDQINDKLTGFTAIIRPDALPAGTYLVGMLAIDRTGRGRIFNWSDVKLAVQA